MSVLESLKSVQNKPYTAVYSGRLTGNAYQKYLKNNLISNNSQQNTPNTQGASNKAILLAKQQHKKQQQQRQQFEFDNESNASTNISLLSLTSVEKREKSEYGKVDYFSPFECLTNKLSRKRLRDYVELIQSTLRQYSKFLMRDHKHGDSSAPQLFELLEPDELSKLYDLFECIKAIPFRIRSNSVCGFRNIKYNERKHLNRKSATDKREYGFLQDLDLKKRHSLEVLDKLEVFYDLDTTNDEKSRKSKDLTESNLMDFDKFLYDDDELYESRLFPDELKVHAPKLFEKSKLPKNFDQNHSQLRAQTDLREYRRSKRYEKIESKLKPYIKSNNKNTTGMFVQRRRQMTAIRRHLLTSIIQNKPFQFSTLKNCNQLDTALREESRLRKGPIYFLPLTVENLNQFTGSSHTNLFDKYLYLFDWLCKLDTIEEFDDLQGRYDESVLHKKQSSTIQRTDEHLILSVLKYNTAGLTPITKSSMDTKQVNNIILPKLKVQINPAIKVNESSYSSFNDKVVVDIVTDYKRAKDEKEINLLKEKASNSMPHLNPETRQIIRQRMRKAKLRHDYVLAEMRLDNYIL